MAADKVCVGVMIFGMDSWNILSFHSSRVLKEVQLYS